MSGRRLVLLIYTQRGIPGRPFELVGSLGGLTLAATLRSRGFAAQSYTGITVDVVRTIRERISELFAVCFYCDFDNQNAIASISRVFRDAPFYKLVGGPQTLHMSPEDFSELNVDAVLCGDGEETLPAWLEARANGNVAPAPLPQETTAQKKGDFELLRSFGKYPVADDRLSLNAPGLLFSVITARGCPHRCAFCFEGGNSKVLRQRSPAEVLDEIELRLERSRHLKYLFFADDTFTFDMRRLEAILQGLVRLRKKRDFVWFCEGHASFFRRYPEAMADMVKAGMVRMQIGMESGNDRVLELYGKHIRAEDIRYTARLAWEAGLPQLCGNFIIGGAWESHETLDQTRSFVQVLLREFPGLLDLSTTFPIPLPGTRLSERPEDYGIIWLDREFVTSLEDVPVNRTKALRAEEICSARSAFLGMVLREMRALAADGRIPRERVRRSLELTFRYGIVDSWCDAVYQRDARLMAYYRAILVDGFLEWSRVCDQRPEEVTPVRVVPWEKVNSDTPEALIRLLAAADGRTLAELRDAFGLSWDALRSLMREAEERCLLVFWKTAFRQV